MQTQSLNPSVQSANLLSVGSAEFTLRKQEIIARIALIDLGPIKFKLAHEDGISTEKLVSMEDLYRKYLVLTQLFPGETIVPTKFIDTMWHAHILDTAKYRDDCQLVFGIFLDHFPYLGLRGAEDAVALATSFTSTQKLFLEVFGVQVTGEASACEGTECGGTACGNSNCGKVSFVNRPFLN
jgi:hypothetical protein